MSCQSIDDIIKNVSDIKSKIVSSGINISNYFMSDRKIAKKLLSTKSPSLKDRELNLMVYGRDIESEIPNYKPYFSESDKMISYDGPYKALKSDDPIFLEVETIKNQITTAVFMLKDKSISLVSDSTQLGVLISTSVPAMVALAVTIPVPNIPGALSLLLVVLESFSTLKSKMKDILPILDVFEKIKLVISPDKQENIASILSQIFSDFSSAVDKIFSLEEAIKKLLGNESPEKKTNDIKDAKENVDKAKKELIPLGYYKTVDDAKNDFPDKDIDNGISKYDGGYVITDKKKSWINNWKLKNHTYDDNQAESSWQKELSSLTIIYDKAVNDAKGLLPT